MNAGKAIKTLDEFLNQDDEPGGVWPDEARRALDTVRLQLAEYQRVNRALVVENQASRAREAEYERVNRHQYAEIQALKAERDALRAQLEKKQADSDDLHRIIDERNGQLMAAIKENDALAGNANRPVTVLRWQDAAVVPGTPDWYLLAFSASGDLIGVGLATYDSVRGWGLIGGHFDYTPIAYAAVVLPEGFKDAFKTTRR